MDTPELSTPDLFAHREALRLPASKVVDWSARAWFSISSPCSRSTRSWLWSIPKPTESGPAWTARVASTVSPMEVVARTSFCPLVIRMGESVSLPSARWLGPGPRGWAA